MNEDSKVAAGFGGCLAFILAVNICVGGWSVRFLVENLAHKVIPWGWAIVIGLFAGEVTVPVAIVVWILKHVGVL